MNNQESSPEKILPRLPSDPGVYLMKDASGEIIYVGKARNLRKRVSSYFNKKGHEPKTALMVSHIATIEFIVTASEMEALILENNLIKKEWPRYNIRLKDDKSYPYIAITLSEDYPRVIYTRSAKKKGDRYFGPYTDAKAAKESAELLNRIFKLRTCKKNLPLKEGERPCLNYQLGRCSGVCVGHISREEYRELVEQAARFLEGEIDPVINVLNQRMQQHAAKMEYEQAKLLRDMIFNLQQISASQQVEMPAAYDQDFLALERSGDEAIILIFEFRRGILIGRKVRVLANAAWSDASDIMGIFLVEYYSGRDIPLHIVLQHPLEQNGDLARLFSSRSGKNVKVSAAKGNEQQSVIRLLERNLNAIIAERSGISGGEVARGVITLQNALELSALPLNIACFDISNFQGTDAVASMSYLRNGQPFKKEYRRFRIRGWQGANDPGMIHEAVARYIQGRQNEDLPLPDLILIDGGPTQLTRAIEAATALEAHLPIISIAKRFEEIFIDPKKAPLRLDADNSALQMLQLARDESHRFGVSYHRLLRSKRTLTSDLDRIKGVGPSRRTALLKAFGSVDAIRQASDEQLLKIEGMNTATVRAIRDWIVAEQLPEEN